METGIFHLVYAEMFGGQKLADIFYKKYLSLYQNFHPVILFLDTKPAVSFRRRKPYYLKRIKKAGVKDPKEKQQMLKKYKKTIFQLYPLWLSWYKKLPFEKYVIRNSYKSEKMFLEEVMAFCKKRIAVKT